MKEEQGRSKKYLMYGLIQELMNKLESGDQLPPPWDELEEELHHGRHQLSTRLLQECDIQTLSLGRQVIPGFDGNDSWEFHPDRLWVIEVHPSFHNHGLIAVFEGRSHVRCAVVCAGDLHKQQEPVVVSHLFPIAQWNDPVHPILESFTLSPAPIRMVEEDMILASVDGVSYKFSIQTHEIQSTLRFSNPSITQYQNLVFACFGVAEMIAKQTQNPQVSSFVKSWSWYLQR